MKFKARRLLGVPALCLIFGLWLSGCSGDQQAEDGVEVSEQGEGQGANDGNAAGGNNSAAEGGNAAGDNASPGGEAAAGAATAAAGSENDLQEIIQEMNGQPAGETPPAAPLPQNTASAAPPAAPPAATPSPAPQASASAIPFQPGGTPAGKGLPEIGSKMAYVVEKGDTLGRISQKIYGSPGRWKELASLSEISNPAKIFPGDLIYYTLDEGAVKFAEAYESISRSEEQVKAGDTLATIAKRIYGTTTAWRSIWRQNDKIDNPDIVPPGTTVYYLPHGSSATALNKVHHNKTIKLSNKFKTTQKSTNLTTNKLQNSTNTYNLTTKSILSIKSTQPTPSLIAFNQIQTTQNQNFTNNAISKNPSFGKIGEKII